MLVINMTIKIFRSILKTTMTYLGKVLEMTKNPKGESRNLNIKM